MTNIKNKLRKIMPFRLDPRRRKVAREAVSPNYWEQLEEQNKSKDIVDAVLDFLNKIKSK